MAKKNFSSRAGDKPARALLVETWISDHGAMPPKGMSSRLLALSAAFLAQAREVGGLSPNEKKRLTAIVNAETPHLNRQDKGSAVHRPSPGTRLVREWNGRSHVVDVNDNHVTYDGKIYMSLSAVARAITGTRWSGPRFFGLTPK